MKNDESSAISKSGLKQQATGTKRGQNLCKPSTDIDYFCLCSDWLKTPHVYSFVQWSSVVEIFLLFWVKTLLNLYLSSALLISTRSTSRPPTSHKQFLTFLSTTKWKILKTPGRFFKLETIFTLAIQTDTFHAPKEMQFFNKTGSLCLGFHRFKYDVWF